jgi:hypothetical protein
MSLTSIWKYALSGIYLTAYFLTYGESSFKMSKVLHFQSLLAIIVLIFITVMTLIEARA